MNFLLAVLVASAFGAIVTNAEAEAEPFFSKTLILDREHRRYYPSYTYYRRPVRYIHYNRWRRSVSDEAEENDKLENAGDKRAKTEDGSEPIKEVQRRDAEAEPEPLFFKKLFRGGKIYYRSYPSSYYYRRRPFRYSVHNRWRRSAEPEAEKHERQKRDAKAEPAPVFFKKLILGSGYRRYYPLYTYYRRPVRYVRYNRWRRSVDDETEENDKLKNAGEKKAKTEGRSEPITEVQRSDAEAEPEPFFLRGRKNYRR